MRTLKVIVGILSLLGSLFAQKVDYERYTLDNGLVVFIAQKPELPIFQAILAVKTGSIYDATGKEGGAYLVTQLLDKGTKNRNAPELARALEELGGEINFQVEHEVLWGSLTILSDYQEKGLEILADLFLNPIFPQMEVDKEKGRIQSEILQDKSDPDQVVEEAFWTTLYEGHPLGNPIKGKLETIKNLTRDDVLSFYQNFFLPNNAVLVVVSPLEIPQSLQLVKRLFAPWEKQELSLPYINESIPPTKTKVKVIDMDVNQSFVALGHLGLTRNDSDYILFRTMNYPLGGGGFVSRLFKEVRNEKGYAYYVNSYLYPLAGFKGPFKASLQTKTESTSDAIKLLLEIIGKTKSFGISKEELSDAKGYFEGSVPRRLETYRQVAEALLNQELYSLAPNYWLKEMGQVKSFPLEEINRCAKQYLDPENYVLVIVAKRDSLKLDLPGVKPEDIQFESLK